LQELYFVSYALWNYLATPFVFTEPGFETHEIGPHEENGETWHRLLVKYPPSIPTHCAEEQRARITPTYGLLRGCGR
jgi:hypothetical protein